MTIDYNPLKNSQVHTDINTQNTTKPKKDKERSSLTQNTTKKHRRRPWQEELSWLERCPDALRLRVPSPVRAHPRSNRCMQE